MDLLTVAEAAEFMHIPLATLRHWIATNQAPTSARIGRHRMFLKHQLEEFVLKKFHSPTAPDDK
jgi:excisionase family DNA binding protein